MVFKFLNLIFRLFLIFLICFIWVRYFINDLSLALSITAILTFSFEIIIRFVLDRRKEKNQLKAEEEKLAEKITSNFIFDNKMAIDYFYNLSLINHKAKKNKEYIEIYNQEDSSSTTILFPYYSYNAISAQDIVLIYKKIEKLKPTKIVICGSSISKEALDISKKIRECKIILLDSKRCFLKLIKHYNYYPEGLKEVEITTKPKFKDLLKSAISKKRAKGYLVASLILLFSSFIVRINIYYVIFSSVLLLLSLWSFFFPLEKTKIDDDIL